MSYGYISHISYKHHNNPIRRAGKVKVKDFYTYRWDIEIWADDVNGTEPEQNPRGPQFYSGLFLRHFPIRTAFPQTQMCYFFLPFLLSLKSSFLEPVELMDKTWMGRSKFHVGPGISQLATENRLTCEPLISSSHSLNKSVLSN